MSCRTEATFAQSYRFCPDPPPVAADRMRALLRARLLDEITGEPIEIDAACAPACTVRVCIAWRAAMSAWSASRRGCSLRWLAMQ